MGGYYICSFVGAISGGQKETRWPSLFLALLELRNKTRRGALGQSAAPYLYANFLLTFCPLTLLALRLSCARDERAHYATGAHIRLH